MCRRLKYRSSLSLILPGLVLFNLLSSIKAFMILDGSPVMEIYLMQPDSLSVVKEGWLNGQENQFSATFSSV